MTIVICERVQLDKQDPREAAVAVSTAQGGMEYVQVPSHFLHEEDGKEYLPVSIVSVDRGSKRVLVQLPAEADSGANRVWVSRSNILDPDKVLA
jgi:hypothetical protein